MLHLPLNINFARTERLSDDEFYFFCRDNADLRIERQSDGTITIMSPESASSSSTGTLILYYLVGWNLHSAMGKVFGAAAGFTLPDSSVKSADVSWISNERLQHVPKEEMHKFPKVCPDFVVEVLSPSDSIKATERKMQKWIENGAQLGWLIDPVREIVKIYAAGKDMKTQKGFNKKLVAGDLMPTFELDLKALKALIH